MDVFKTARANKEEEGLDSCWIKSQVLVALSILVGLFFIEYPSLFLLGHWSWGAAVHKALTGAFLITNLVIAQYVARRLRFFRGGRRVDRKGAQEGLRAV